MSVVEVATLKLRCTSTRQARAQFAIEDALRTELPDDDRLVLVRRLRVGAPGSSSHAGRRQAAMREAWQAAVGDARHGADDGAPAANCVWFASRDEAERVLLAWLLAGRSVAAWFWPLALPRWRGQREDGWVRDCIADALASHDGRRILALVEACVSHGAVELLIAALSTAAELVTDTEAAISRSAFLTGVPAVEARQGSSHAADATAMSAVVRPVSLPAALREVLTAVLRADAHSPVIDPVLRAIILRGSPALRLHPRALDAAIIATRRAILQQPGATMPLASRSERVAAAPEPITRAPGEQTVRASTPTTTADPPDDRTESDAPACKQPPGEPRADDSAQSFQPASAFRHSDHAGIWLVVPSLISMGFREWLADRPALCGEHPGRQLMLAIARRHRVPHDDPALTALTLRGDEVLPDWTQAWRHGLDRWLRRCARRRLHDLVRRPGRLTDDAERVLVRFPPSDADLRLRRLALDRDPGWVDWLGLSLRYQFRDVIGEGGTT